MKKLIAILLLVCLLPLCVLAEMDEDGNVTVVLDGAEVFFTPVDGYCLTRETSASVYNRVGLSQREILPWMEQNDVYALMINQTAEIEAQLTISPTTELDFDDMTKYGLDMMCEVSEGYFRDMGLDVESSKIYHTFDGHSYVKTVGSYIAEDGGTQHVVEYFTCQSGYAVYVTMYSLGEAFTEEQMLLCEGMIESLWLSEGASESAALTEYTELALGKITVRFQLPEDMKLLTKDSGEADWAGLPKGYVWGWKKSLAWGDMHGLCVSPDGKWEIQWQLVDESNGGDMNSLTDEEVNQAVQHYMEVLRAEGSNISYGAGVKVGAYKYSNIRYNYTSAGTLMHAVEYYTCQDGRGLFVTLVSYNELASEEVLSLFRDIIESQIIIVNR